MEWHPIPGYPGYEITRDGKVRTLDRTIVDSLGRTRRLKGVVRKNGRSGGYLNVSLWPHEETRTVHRLVLETFVGPPNGRIARHLNGDRYDNRVENLAWGTYAENTRDMFNHGTHVSQRKTHCKNGHPLEGDNIRPSALAKGRRVCRTCDRERARTYRANKAAGLTPDRPKARRKAQSAPSPAQT